MYFQNYRLRKPWVDKCIKSLILEGNSKRNMVNGPKHLLINVKAIKSEKSLLVVCKILGLFVKTLSVCRKFCLLNRDKLRQSIQMQLCKKQKAFS